MADKVNNLLTSSPRNARFGSGKQDLVVDFQTSITSANSAAGDKIVLAEGLSFADRMRRKAGADQPSFQQAPSPSVPP